MRFSAPARSVEIAISCDSIASERCWQGGCDLATRPADRVVAPAVARCHYPTFPPQYPARKRPQRQCTAVTELEKGSQNMSEDLQGQPTVGGAGATDQQNVQVLLDERELRTTY